MPLKNTYSKLLAMAAACLLAAPASAQEVASNTAAADVKTTTAEADPSISTNLSADGRLQGNVKTANAEDANQIANANISLVKQGKVIDSTVADASGQFSFANVNPGPYQVVGTAPGFVGSQAVQVGQFVQSQPTPMASQPIIMHNAPAQAAYNAYSSAPVSSLSAPAGPSFGYAGNGGGFGGGGRVFGGASRGFGNGRLLSSPRGLLVVGGIVGGLAAINDSSPDN